jgi:hypothetical protein
MSSYTATIRWHCKESREGFAKGQYSRAQPLTVTLNLFQGLFS